MAPSPGRRCSSYPPRRAGNQRRDKVDTPGKLGRCKQRPYPIGSIVQSLFDFGFGDSAFADYVPVVAIEANDGAGQDATGVACI